MQIILYVLDAILAVVLFRDFKLAWVLWTPIPFIGDFEISIKKRRAAVAIFWIGILMLGGSVTLAAVGYVAWGYKLFAFIAYARIIKLLLDRRRMRDLNQL